MKSKIIFFLSAAIAMGSCSGGLGGNKKLSDYGNATEEADNTIVNIIEQSKPTIMVLPGDNLLQHYSALSTVTKNGATYVTRDYSKYFLSNPNNKIAISALQNEFVQLGYPLTDLEQTLKSLNKREATSMADNVEQDAKTLLLQAASPDIILELDYDFKMDALDPNFGKKLQYTITAFDSYTNKAFSSKTVSDKKGTDFNDVFSKSIHSSIKSLSSEINDYFKDIVIHGREITVRVTVVKGANINLSDESISGDTYADWIMDYMDIHTKKGTYKLQNNTNYELYFTEVRIPTTRTNGTQYNAYNWARDFMKEFKSDCGAKCSNKAQGLGDVHIMIKGI